MMPTSKLAATAILFAAALALPLQAEAGRRGVEPDFVTAHSRHGNGSVDGAVRAGRKGYEVQLPSGSWVGCRRSCSETLRVQTVDFWENDGSMVGAGTAGNECGVFGCLDIGRR